MRSATMSDGSPCDVDTTSMVEDIDIIQLKRNPEWRATLLVYYGLQVELREKSPDSDGWIPRPIEFAGIDPSKVSSIHGKLIAFGFLKFDVSGRDVGVRYQLTTEGRRALQLDGDLADDSADTSELAESA